jgi:hypothetical protein
VALANHHLAIIAVAYLYNALHKMGLTDIVWPDHDRIIKLQAGPIFADDVPSTPEEMRARVCYRFGVDRNMVLFTTDLRKLARRDLTVSDASTLLLKFFQTKEPLERTIYQLQENIQRRQLAQAKQSDKSEDVNKGKITKISGPVSQRKFIGQLQDSANVAVAIAETSIPYMGLAKIRIHLLQYIRKRLELSGYALQENKHNPNDLNDYNLTYMVVDILKENDDTWTATKKPGLLLKLASIECRRMWKYMNSDELKVNRPLYFPDGDMEESEAGTVRT